MEKKVKLFDQVTGRSAVMIFDKQLSMTDELHAKCWVIDEIFEAVDAFKKYMEEPSDANWILLQAEIIDGVVLAHSLNLNYLGIVSDIEQLGETKTGDSKGAGIDKLRPGYAIKVYTGNSFRTWSFDNFSNDFNATRAALQGILRSNGFPKAYIYWKLKSIRRDRKLWETYDMQMVRLTAHDSLYPNFSEEGRTDGK